MKNNTINADDMSISLIRLASVRWEAMMTEDQEVYYFIDAFIYSRFMKRN